MIFKDYYKILGLETNKVTLNQIKIAYRDQAKKFHPDVNDSKTAEERFKDLTEAYRILSDTSQKRKYDRIWNYNIGRKKKLSKKEQDAKFTDFFNMFFGSQQETPKKKKEEKEDTKPHKGENSYIEIPVTIPEAFYGREKKIVIKNIEGNNKSFDIKIPEGIKNNDKIRIIGFGKEGKNGGKNGDLYVTVKIQDSDEFKLKGLDIETELYLTPWEACLSKNVDIKGIDEEIDIKIPEGIQNGEKIVIKGKGYKDRNGERGDLIAEAKIMVPQAITKEEEKLYQRLEEISKFNPRQ